MKKSLPVIIIGYSLSFVILIIAFLFSRRLYNLVTYSDRIEHTYRVRNQILKVQAHLAEAESSQRGFILIKDSTNLTPISKSQSQLLKEVEILKELTKNNALQQEILVKLKADISLRYTLLYETLEDVSAGNKDEFLLNARKGERIMDDFKSLAAKMENVELDALRDSEQKKEILEKQAPLYLSGILIISSLFQMISFVFITREFQRSSKYHKQLEKNIHELNISNSELEQIAFVASHDLQEPLRKIRTFSDRLLFKHKEDLNEEGKKVVERIIAAATRMQGLIQDLIQFTKLLKTEEELQHIDLNESIGNAVAQLQEQKSQKNAIINIDHLPTITGYKKQLDLLFINLIENALKFTHRNVTPVINISVSHANGEIIDPNNRNLVGKTFYKISISDNGIGFDKDFQHKLFILFQRLHTQNSPYPGKGVGLALCKRIIINHHGYITANAAPGTGATFNTYFPERPVS